MNFSQNDEIVESSQRSIRHSNRVRKKRANTTQRRTRISQRIATQQQSRPLFDISDNSTEEHSPNLSGSLFEGRKELLQQYDDHEKIQNLSKNIPVDTDSTGKHNVHPPVSLDIPDPKNRNDAKVQTIDQLPQFRDVHVQCSPSAAERSVRDASVQMSPDSHQKRTNISIAINTDQMVSKDESAQTTRLETREVAVQKYHSTRVCEVSVQTSDIELRRNVSKRNVCIQHNSCDILELTEENALRLGIELKCDPPRLQRTLMRLSVLQSYGNDTSSRSAIIDFTDDDPYWSNYGFFMDDCTEHDVTVSTDSGVFEEAAIANYYSVESFQ